MPRARTTAATPTSGSRVPRLAALGASGLLALGLVGLGATPAHAATFSVATSAELIDAINTANGNGQPDTIQITADIALSTHLPSITGDLAIIGNSHTLDARSWGAFVFTYVTASIEHLTIINTTPGAIKASDTHLTLDSVAVRGSQFGHNLGVHGGTVDIVNSSFAGPAGVSLVLYGGSSRVAGSSFTDTFGSPALYIGAEGTAVVEVVDSSASDNDQHGIDVDVAGDAALTITDSEASNNAGRGLSGELQGAGSLVVTDFAALDNAADGMNGIDLRLVDDATLALTRVTASGNNRGDGVHVGAYDRAAVTLDAVTAERNAEDGVDIDISDDAGLTASGLLAVENEASGIRVGLGSVTGEVTVADSVSRGNLRGVDADLSGDGSAVSFLRVDTLDNDEDGYLITAADGGSVTIDESTSSGNAGPGLRATLSESELLVSRSTVSGSSGSGIELSLDASSSASVVDSTVSGNGASGIDVVGSEFDFFRLLHSTVVGNLGPGAPGVKTSGLVAVVGHSILWGNEAGDLAVGDALTTLAVEWSLVGTAVGTEAQEAVELGIENLAGVDPLLGPLADNGGPTLTHLPRADSPVIDRGEPGILTLPADQRGEPRIQGPRIDLGSVEIPYVAPEEPAPAALPETGADPAAPLALATLLLLLGAALAVGVSALRRA